MEAFPVTLIVKVPNQQIEDQTVKCELSWTINKLKQHLSEVHPSKPAKHEQRLIYSGQLLPDTACLKDILRQYEGQEVHTVHLVCVSKNDMFKCQSSPSSITSRMSSSTNSSSNVASESSDVNREQRVPNFQYPNMSQFPNYNQIDSNQYALQMAWMQQAYIQYMMQYMNSATNPNYNNTTGNVNQRNVAEQPQVVNRPAAAARDPDIPERDWLDVFYMVIRMMVLFSIVYFYSSPLRFIVVLMLGVVFYLYQIGFFRNLNNNNNNNNTPADHQNIEHSPSVLTIMWTFFTTFFASLIPEIPNAV
ncbi:homocysteine-responsive endoplasmic reticulum-resident ubiquitin-like domain member 2 protein [Agrilus planipennis]|uniref:Homocysteine-responsive endoplasmic reticulum-resident ubiquitin-like domain member 2 protein n=1 Tax=Agrilus planipennis TaxID=224129 RepID=A0A1W4WFN9_AGRPL|nr:homocysteine-responsive endoplasmic reticulum-resident ubiquitin-like domain member 2 protein [Agrilus planipennis]